MQNENKQMIKVHYEVTIERNQYDNRKRIGEKFQ